MINLIDSSKLVNYKSIRPAPWRSTHTLKPDLKVLSGSLGDIGWVSPLIVQLSTGYIIDGFHRWVCAQTNKQILERDDGMVPVIFFDIDEIDSIVMHLRLNRGRGQIVTKLMSNAIRTIMFSRKYTEDELKDLLTITNSEMGVLVDGSVIKERKIKEHVYSRAWVPIEAESPAGQPVLERPPNKDR